MNNQFLTKINSRVEALPSIIDGAILKLSAVHAVPSSIDELFELIAFHNANFSAPDIMRVNVKVSTGLLTRAPHYITSEDFYI